MSLFAAIFDAIANAIAPSAVPTTAAASAPLIEVGSLPITVGELKAGVQTLTKFPFDAIEKVFAEHFADIHDDAIVGENIAGALAAVGVPFAADVDFAIMAIAWIAANGAAASSTAFPGLAPPPNGGIVGAFLDSIHGIKRPVVVE